VTATDGTNIDMFSANGSPGTSWASSGSSGVAVDGSGNVWVSSATDNVVREYDQSGSLLQTVNSLALSGPKGVAVSGKLFVADAGNDRVARFGTDGSFETSWTVTGVLGVAVSGSTVLVTDGTNVRSYSFDGVAGTTWSSAGAKGIAVDGSGNVWVASNAGVVRSYSPAGVLRFTVGAGILSDPVALSVAGGKLYVADAGDGTIKKFSTSFGYSFEWGQYLNTLHDGVEDNPIGVAADLAGNVYVTNTDQDVIQEYDIAGNWIRDIGGTGTTFGLLENPQAVAIAPSGVLYVADTTNQRVQRFSAAGAWQAAWGSYGTAAGMFNNPAGIAIDSSGNVYVADTGNNRIQKFDADGNFLTSWGGYGTSTGQLKSPRGLTVVGSSVWVADSANNRVQRFSTAGTFQSVIGSFGSSDGKLSAPQDVAVDGEGTLWVVEKNNNRIQRYSAAGAFLSKLGSYGLDAGQFDGPSGLEIDAAGNVLVADTKNDRVEVFIDANGPDVTFLTGPGTATTSPSASFTFSANEPGSTFGCKLDGALTWTPCVSGVSYSSLAEGSHTLAARATDTNGFVGNPATYTWAVDVTPPTVSITNTPVSPSSSTSPSFSFTSSEQGSTFLCKLDTATPSSCGSPKAVSVTNGDHTFKVWAIDPAGNQSTTPAMHSWTVDTTPPTVTIDSGPSGWVALTDATFKFSSGDATATFECHMDGASFVPCASPTTYSSLSAAQHTFYVRAIDDLGNISADKTRTFTVDLSDHKPDSLISTGKTYVGDGIYNTTGINQAKTKKQGVNTLATFTLRFENDGTDKDTYTIKGAGSKKGYDVTYWIGTTTYTTKVTAGTLTFVLGPGQYKLLTMRVRVGASGKSSASFLVNATSGHDPTKSDVVKGIVKRV
jgi:sugar lactone lactonase YvrE